MSERLAFGDGALASLDGTWDFFPGDHSLEDLSRIRPESIRVPALWESEGHVDLDGVAWYRRRFVLEEVSGFWTLTFGAVMDVADVFLNGVELGRHELPFTPFSFDATEAVVLGDNVLAVRVFDPPLDHPEHTRLPHGKQGWANHVFPSRPSLYMTYGGIWQSVSLRRHGPVVVNDVFVNGDPDDLVARIEIENRAGQPVRATVGIRAVALVWSAAVELAPGASATLEAPLGRTAAGRWTPEHPALHHALVDAVVDGVASDSRTVRFGLRTVRLIGSRMEACGTPYRMKSALVQGFRSDGLYAEGSRESIREEVLAAKAMGFNTLRLHIKAFHPVYLNVCDEEGMFLHCDIPVAEPLAYDEMGEGTVLLQRSVAAVREQVRRDRNHPSVILWSAMNEIGDQRREIRSTPAYEQLARALYAAVVEEDPTRPVIENDWVEPDPEHVFVSPILTAHWYGRLHADYLHRLEQKTERWAGEGRVFFVSEYGDWGLPDMPELVEQPFWDARDLYAAGLAQALWPGTLARFLRETQRYQGLSDRLQTEIFRRHEGVDGYCLTELTDVPLELNGLLDLDRQPKPLAVAEMTRANQVVLPMLKLDTLVLLTGTSARAPLHVANDGPALRDVRVEVRFGPDDAAVADVRVPELAGYCVSSLGEIEVPGGDVPGSHDLTLTLTAGEDFVSENRYPVHVFPVARAEGTVRLLGVGSTLGALQAVGAEVTEEEGPTVVAEDGLDAAVAAEVQARLLQGETVVVLAQPPEAGQFFPGGAELLPVGSGWGSSVFHFTTDESPLSSLPRRGVLVAEDSTIHALSAIATLGGTPFPARPVVISYKPDPGAFTGTIVGEHEVGGGRLIVCQYRLADRALAGDAAARALLGDIVRWALTSEGVVRERMTAPDGSAVHVYSFPMALA
ncbi:MAG TPA: glycoside hydrolase family 2 TIM barrel-domain containing protein [Gaiellaceae bacterium]|nr:glycoside hydrolase family 2 TIM barrel-domain containing protein [Gaiellaceae bacterium]